MVERTLEQEAALDRIADLQGGTPEARQTAEKLVARFGRIAQAELDAMSTQESVSTPAEALPTQKRTLG